MPRHPIVHMSMTTETGTYFASAKTYDDGITHLLTIHVDQEDKSFMWKKRCRPGTKEGRLMDLVDTEYLNEQLVTADVNCLACIVRMSG